MTALSEVEAEVVSRHPIRPITLDGIMADVHDAIGCNPAEYPAMLRSPALSEEVRTVAFEFILRLASISTAVHLPSRLRGENLRNDLLDFLQSNDLRRVDINAMALLVEKVVNRAADADIWGAAYNIFPATPPTTPDARVTIGNVLDTPFVDSSGAVHNTEELRENMVISSELRDHIYLDLSDFFAAFFDSVDGLQSLATAVFAECQQKGFYSQERWSSFPESCKESSVVAWFGDEVQRLADLASAKEISRTVMLESRCVFSRPRNSLEGSTAKRTMDIGFAIRKDPHNVEATSSNQHYGWSDILVPGELKSNKNKDSTFATWCDLARYVREVYAAQDSRRFSYGFTLCGDMLRVWKFDRGAVYAAPPFSVNQDGQRFVAVMLGFLLMGEEELGYDTTISRDDDQRYISVVRDGIKERYRIEKMIHRQPSIIGRGTTCWKATLEGSNEMFVVKDSWQYEGRADEGALLTECTPSRYVAPCHYSETVRIGEMDDDLCGNVRKNTGVSSGVKWKWRGHSTTAFSTSASSSSLHKRVASTTLENTVQKRSRTNTKVESGNDSNPNRSDSNTKGESGNDSNPNRSDSNRLHKRIIMSRYGKPLYLTETRVGLLRGLIDGISGHEHLFVKNGVLHRDISIGNVLISEDESEGFLIDLDHAIRVDRAENSGALGRTGTRVFMPIGTRVFMSIGLLRQSDSQRESHSFMDDLESMFWVLFWICVHYTGPGSKQMRRSRSKYEGWNYRSPSELSTLKAGEISKEADFLSNAHINFTDFYKPLIPWINKLRRVVFPGGERWENENLALYGDMKKVLLEAMNNEASED